MEVSLRMISMFCFNMPMVRSKLQLFLARSVGIQLIAALSIQTNYDELVHGFWTRWNVSDFDSRLTKAMMLVPAL